MLTSRRAVLLGRRPVRGRLRLSDRSLRFDPLEGPTTEVPLGAIRRVALGRSLLVEEADRVLRLRCFGLRGVALMLVAAVGSA